MDITRTKSKSSAHSVIFPVKRVLDLVRIIVSAAQKLINRYSTMDSVSQNALLRECMLIYQKRFARLVTIFVKLVMDRPNSNAVLVNKTETLLFWSPIHIASILVRWGTQSRILIQ